MHGELHADGGGIDHGAGDDQREHNEVLTTGNNDSSTVVPVNGPSAGADMTSTVSCVPNPANAGPR